VVVSEVFFMLAVIKYVLREDVLVVVLWLW